MSPNNFLNSNQAAELLGIKPETLAIWRYNKRYALTYIKIGSKVFYRREDIESFIIENTITFHANKVVS